MGKPGNIMITQRGNKDLRLMLEPTESFGIDDTIAVALETGPYGARLLPPQAASTELTLGSIRRKGFFPLLRFFPRIELANHRIIAMH
jgi:hypothetical protein